MKKKIFTLIMAAAIAASLAGCGKQEQKQSQVVDGAAQTTPAAGDISSAEGSSEQKSAEQIQDEMDNFAKDADKNADMSKIDGTELEASAVEGFDTSGDLGGFEVKILGAKAADSDEGKVLVVEFEFKNNTSAEANFAGTVKTIAMQDESNLPPAAVYSAEGFEPATIAQPVGGGESIRVQKAFKLISEDTPVSLQAMLQDTIASGGAAVAAEFKLK